MRMSVHLATMLIVGAVSPLPEQGPGALGGPPPMGGMGPGRGEVRLLGMRARMDSAGLRLGGPRAAGDSAARSQARDRLGTDARRMREQFATDQRDAITVLTPDQQARAWQMVSRDGMRGRRAGMGMRGMGGGGMRRGGMPGMGGRGMRRDFGPEQMGPDGARRMRPGRPFNPRRPPPDSAQVDSTGQR